MWKMGVQLKGRNSYVTLVFTEDCTFQLNVVEMESAIEDAKAAVCKLFALSHPVVLQAGIPRSSLKEVLDELNPVRLLNPKYVPWRAIVPSKSDSKICLCLEVAEEFLRVGLMLETAKPASARIKKNSQEIAFIINLISSVCRGYLRNTHFPEDYISSLASLLVTAKTENLGIATGEGLYKL